MTHLGTSVFDTSYLVGLALLFSVSIVGCTEDTSSNREVTSSGPNAERTYPDMRPPPGASNVGRRDTSGLRVDIEGEGGLAPDVFVGFTPSDRTTNVGSTATPEVTITGAGWAGDVRRIVDAVDDVASLRTWPDNEVVPHEVSTTYHREESREDVFRGSASISVAPTSDLDSGWYALTLEAIPRSADWSGHNPALHRLESGLYGARFHVGSSPRVRKIVMCDKGKLSLRFSEPVALDGKDDLRDVIEAGYVSDRKMGGELLNEHERNDIQMITIKGIDAHFDAEVRINIDAGLVSESNVAFEPVTRRFRPSNAVKTEDGHCRAYFPDVRAN